ncbi:hypothetical protein E4T39_05338 [Aureobasidium subglaciale]|nr:hypothetical protein E4T39_05338 [Aureobasidium subglaciale]
MSYTQEMKARCLCGDYQLSISVPQEQLPLTASICHCDSCRHGSGTLYMGAAYVPDDCVKTVQDSLSGLKASEWSSRRTSYLCSTCGSTVIGKLDGRLWIHTGALDQLEDIVKIQRQIYVKDTQDGGFSNWLEDLPTKVHATLDDGLPVDWPNSTGTKQTKMHSDRLHVHCLCKGVNFWISRPLTSSADPNNSKSDVNCQNSDRGDYDIKDPWWLCAGSTKFRSSVCSCNSCRLASSCDFVQWAFVPTSDISLSADGSVPFSYDIGTLKGYRSSDIATRYFCGECGAMVFWNGDDRPGLMDVAVGLIDAAEGSLAQDWLEWITNRVSYKCDGIDRAKTLVNHVEVALNKWGQDPKTSGSRIKHDI